MSIDATRATWKLNKQITAIQKLILLSLADRAGEDGECWPSIKRLEADTCLNRKTIIENRQKLINLGLIEYTGELKGKKKQIPVMRLTYINNREFEQDSTSTESGTDKMLTSTENGTRTSTENGTLNLTEESKINNTSVSNETPEVAQEIINAYHEILPEMPRCLFVTKDLNSAVKKLIAGWPELTGDEFSIAGICGYFTGIKETASFFTRPYITKDGNKRRSSLLNLIRIETIKKFANGEYSA